MRVTGGEASLAWLLEAHTREHAVCVRAWNEHREGEGRLFGASMDGGWRDSIGWKAVARRRGRGEQTPERQRRVSIRTVADCTEGNHSADLG